ncbi:MAG: MFS transporter family glucose-6-phosphate receptor UhpC [Simkaniaceae bacterium]|nr:MFS transporter family glucose-6-phosphate receptor UhpC [Simkaniaceae bacterium]
MKRLFKPAPHKPEIEDKEEVRQLYKYWRMRIFYSIYIGYAFYYFTRKSLIAAMPGLVNDLGFDMARLGILTSVFAIAYGASKFLSGVISDRSNPRYFMAIGLIITCVINIFFGMSSSIYLFVVLWGLNGWFQGWGWPPCGRQLTHWYSHSERGTWWGIWNTSHNIGGAIVPFIGALVMTYFGWRWAMYIPGVMSILIGFFLINRLRDTPQSLALPPIEKYRNDYDERENQGEDQERELTTKELLFKYVLSNKFIWLLAISYFFVYVVRTGINDLGILYLTQNKGMSTIMASTCITWFEIGGFFGSLFSGWISDNIFSGRRGPVNALFSLGCGGAIAALWFVPGAQVVAFSVTVFFIGFFIFGPQMLIGMAAAELSHKKAAGTATGFIGWIAYAGAATAGYPLGVITEKFGWYGYIVAVGGCAVISFLLLLPFWRVKTKKDKVVLTGNEDPSEG